jgi:hypothetical protein
MNQFISGRILTLALLVASVLTPAGYGRQQSAASSDRPVVSRSFDSQKLTKAEPFARTQLFFGADKPDGTEVTEEEWRRFLDREVTWRFPDGLTVLTGVGQFRDASGAIVQERSKVLILLYPSKKRKESDRKIELIRGAYKRDFSQESVLRVDDRRPVLVSF